ncbi:MAG TPA: molybdate ABC transporter substrate-binding protein [Streptosporangiaceae bacterium]|nr:molybdate ABC transporter substrate-binding protein [Streptosporangiaceae bacterium]
MLRTGEAVFTAGLAAVALAAMTAGCGSSTTTHIHATSPHTPSGTITVFAASSLQGAFTTIARQFEAHHRGTTVKFSFGPSSGLADQIKSGSPADVFASASPQNMTKVVSAGDATMPKTFAKNIMEVAVPPKNPAHVTSVKSLSKSSVKTAVCKPQVPCGFVARKVFSLNKISVKPVTMQPDVSSVLTQVELNNVDAGMVYATDVKAAGSKVKGIKIPAADNASTSYPIATIKKSPNMVTAEAFASYVLSPAGQKVLADDGFEMP